MLPDQEQLTGLLKQWGAGDKAALDQLMAAVHAELRRLAAFHLRNERPNHSLQPTALVNEVYLRLTDLHTMNWQDRAHFFAMVSRIMRRVLVDEARSRNAQKRGPDVVRVALDEARQVADPATDAPDLLALDDALTALAELDERKAHLVELRFFGGLSMEDAAAILSVSPGTAARDWRTAKLWLRREVARRTAS